MQVPHVFTIISKGFWKSSLQQPMASSQLWFSVGLFSRLAMSENTIEKHCINASATCFHIICEGVCKSSLQQPMASSQLRFSVGLFSRLATTPLIKIWTFPGPLKCTNASNLLKWPFSDELAHFPGSSPLPLPNKPNAKNRCKKRAWLPWCMPVCCKQTQTSFGTASPNPNQTRSDPSPPFRSQVNWFV